ncbi:pilin [Catellatospora chokoriensis]|uniref:TrbC/VIRB2 family protein n=1 Tax=Catellatospora chokoriensis TaxID=310353 RepID=A0A8J3NT04_9ACTN|nr:pilin [Catellatospora chokoriensis]GIF89810.1 hypothetical protein Cch02nite_32540 [Catellatospora chokoriensis]
MHTTVSLITDILAAAPPPEPPAAPASLAQVIENIKGWVMGLLAAIATLFLVVGGLRYIAAGGDPAQVEQAKGNFKSACFGYGLAVLSPLILKALQSIVGTGL